MSVFRGAGRVGAVPGHAVRQMLNSFAAVGIDVDLALVGLGFRRVDLRDPFFRAEWDDFVTFLERVAASTPRNVIERAATHFANSEPSARLIAQRVFVMRLIYWAVLRGTAWLWTGMEMKLRTLPDKRLEWRVRLKEGRPCQLYFELSAIIIAALPRQLGLPDAHVEAEVGGTYGIYRVDLASSEAPEEEIADSAVADLFCDVHTDLRGQLRVPEPGRDSAQTDRLVEQRLMDARTAWGLTERQTDVLKFVAKGSANKEVAARLGCTEATVEAHVTAILRKSGTTSRAQLISCFWML